MKKYRVYITTTFFEQHEIEAKTEAEAQSIAEKLCEETELGEPSTDYELELIEK